MKDSLEKIRSGLYFCVGIVGEVISRILESDNEMTVGRVWMTNKEGVEERGKS